MAPLNDRLESRAKFHILLKNTTDAEREEEGYNDSNGFWQKVRLLTRSIASRYAQTGHSHPIELYEYDLRDLWYMCIQGARITAADHPAQDRLVSQVLHTREMGVLSRKVVEEKEGQMNIKLEMATTSDGRLWNDLPFLVNEISTAWATSMDLPVPQRHNLSSFIARLASVGVRDPELCLVAIWLLRDTLETSRPLVSEKDEHGRSDTEKQVVGIGDLLPAVIAWFQYCGNKIESLCISNQAFESGLSEVGELARNAKVTPDFGFSVARWFFWRDRLEEIGHCENEEVAVLALRGWKMMKFWGERIESVDGKKQDMEWYYGKGTGEKKM